MAKTTLTQIVMFVNIKQTLKVIRDLNISTINVLKVMTKRMILS